MTSILAAEFGLWLPTSTRQWLPGPEPTIITRRGDYKTAARCLSIRGGFFLPVRYAFGRQRTGAIDDAELFEFLRETLRGFHRRIVVLDPNLEAVAGLLEDALSQRIYACKLYWNHFAEAACVAMEEAPGAPNILAVGGRIARLYDERTR